MKLVFLFALLLFLLMTYNISGQKRNNIWIFGNQSGLDFNTNPPSAFQFTGARADTSDYVSSISDTSGNLMFYTDGKEVWNKKHQKMAKQGSEWPWGGYTVPLICPYPDNANLCYMFAVSENLHMLRYLSIDVKGGDDGLGEIIYPPPPIPFNFATTLLNNASVMLAGTGHCNRKDKWIIAHSGSNLFSYLVTEGGVSTLPVVTPIDPLLINPDTYKKGNFKFSSNGEKMVMPLILENKLIVFDFNNLTGKFSNAISLRTPSGMTLEEVEISPDGSKIYLGTFIVRTSNNPFRFNSHLILQMNLDAGSEEDIERSSIELTPYPDQSGCTPRTCFSVNRTMQVSPDGKVYVSFRVNEPYSHIIEEPNIAGIDANYSLYGLKFKTEYNKFNINSIRTESFEVRINGINVKKKNCASEPTSLSLNFKNVDSVKWNFGDPASGEKNYSRDVSNEHLYPGPGSYDVVAIIYKTCYVDTAQATVIISADKAVKLPGWLKDTTVCLGYENIWDVTTPFATTYFWSDGITREARYRIKEQGYYSVTASNECSRDTKRFLVSFHTCDCTVFIPNAFTPNNDNLNDVFKPITKCLLQDYEFKIYSRFGSVIFSTNDKRKGWNGSMGHYMAENGTYIWVISYFDPGTRKFFNKYGTVSLLR